MTKAAAMPWRTAVEHVTEEEREILWRGGQLFWLLHGDQARVYAEYRRWEQEALQADEGLWKRVFVMDCSRRYGKDWLCLVIKIEDCIRRPGSRHTYSTAYQKDITEIVVPLMLLILETCPADCRPKFQGTKLGEPAQQGEVVSEALPEADSRVQDDPSRFQARLPAGCGPLA